jgi:hypothetical protein
MRTIHIQGKCNDLCLTEFFNGNDSYTDNGYPPEIKGLSWGDYIDITVDLDTGKILNWQVPSDEKIMNAMGIASDRFRF